jgi:hypothetical protein
MTQQITRAYLQARRAQAIKTIEGPYIIVQERASDALRAVKVCAEWAEAEAAGLVRLRVEPDSDLDLSYLDQDHYPAKYREAERERANRDGGTGIVSEYFDGEDWQIADSVWGFIGEDWRGSGYDIDLMRSALDQSADREHCPTCGRPRKA